MGLLGPRVGPYFSFLTGFGFLVTPFLTKREHPFMPRLFLRLVTLHPPNSESGTPPPPLPPDSPGIDNMGVVPEGLNIARYLYTAPGLPAPLRDLGLGAYKETILAIVKGLRT